jgi:hypothetical protein
MPGGPRTTIAGVRLRCADLDVKDLRRGLRRSLIAQDEGQTRTRR